MADMIQEIVRLEDTDDIVFKLGKTPYPKDNHTAALGKVKVIGYNGSRGPGDSCFYVIQFEDDTMIRVYNPKNVVFGKPKPQLAKASPGEILALTV